MTCKYQNTLVLREESTSICNKEQSLMARKFWELVQSLATKYGYLSLELFKEPNTEYF